MLGAVVAERAAALRRMAVREAEQRALLAMAPDAVLDIDALGRIRVANAAALRLFGDGAEARKATPVATLLPGLVLGSPEGRATLAGRRGNGEEFPAEIAWARLDPPANAGFLVIVRDASDRRRAETQLRERDAALARAMRFAVAGELASALAHELNQPITALVSYLHASEILSEHAAGDDERLKATLGKAAVEAIRASEVLRRLRDFYQGGPQKRESVHLPTLCNEVASAFQDRVRRLDAHLTVDVEPSIPLLQVDATQLQVVMHNLVGNALDAVSQRPPGRRRVVVRGSHSEGTVVLRVEDSGPGIAAEIARKLFEPFVTSKADGMGLGLAISRSLIRARGGELSLAGSGELGGAAFVVRIPVQAPAEAIVV
jgi:two-component system sensor kinase FixL